ncbi:TetR/AcrR family transcriptional regulator [Frankia sp. AgB1.9]|uniref:Regulatory protein TetR n=1 Tax=Pseudofrankia inefficax (strain DSM 45817 / CECT 9037 / DDB 130130 / EuI1c) TaxID=298654 RepID=E3IVG4_PSEI1|nr:MULTISPECIES: TetR/AcrR family transcriptional regulator [Frankiaceae]ADP81328.1 regulatory protein TetR [Pseudofrankia inefficax]MBL7493561.1 TetR/AcrR family transcriptional regulator [Frankia sp. AgW1.1]MBL7549822.1 TetR/AcrR family transcriptional regulator [Frankia sp. AgB1.9]MBL7622422.1 TetR/AcrR family transcriptional regulator [Frankia sp. AgB1.8]
MPARGDSAPTSSAPQIGRWRERAVERSLTDARAKAVRRGDHYLQTAIQLLAENGDFTLQELVERAKTSFRSFYQYYESKDELLLAVFEDVMEKSANECRSEVEGLADPFDRVHHVVERLYDGVTDPIGGVLSRAMTIYHLQLAESRPADFASVLEPQKQLFVDLVRDGVDRGAFRKDIEPDQLAMILVQTIVAATHMHALGIHLTGVPLTSHGLWDFIRVGLSREAASPQA